MTDNLLPDGYEWVEVEPKWLYAPCDYACFKGKFYIAKPKVRKYNWEKTGQEVLVVDDDLCISPKKIILRPVDISTAWLYHDGGPCPFDAESCYVDVIQRDGDKGTCVAPNEFRWSHMLTGGDIIAVRFNSLKPGVEW